MREFVRRLMWLFHRRRREADLNDELAFHLAAEAEDRVADGASDAEAMYAARHDLGNITLVRENTRAAWGWMVFEQLLQDLRYGLRGLAKSCGFAVTAVLMLALGIGTNTTIFSVVSSILLRKPPIHDPDRVVMLFSQRPGAGSPTDEANRMPVSAADFLDWRAQATSFTGMAARSSGEFTIGSGARPERVPGAVVSANYFQVLGVMPILGRSFLPADDEAGRNRVVLLREDLWKGNFAGNPDVLGQAVRINGEPYTVIGIMPASLRISWLFPDQLWTPLVFHTEQLQPATRNAGFLHVLARLKPGVTESGAKAELVTIAQRVAAAHPETEKGWSANLMTIQRYAVDESNSTTALIFLQCTVGFVLLIACANVVNLLLARNSARQREFAIRTALGASSLRVARQLLTECLTLALAGGSLGLLFSFCGLQLVRSRFNWNEGALHIAESLAIDNSVLIFTFAVSVLAALLVGFGPAFETARRDVSSGLKESSRTTTSARQHHRLQNLLVVGELALSVILLSGAGLFVAYFIQEMHTDPGLNPRNVLTASVRLSGPGYETPAQQTAFFQRVLERITRSPGVVAAAIASNLPFTFPGMARVAIEGHPVPLTEKQPLVGYFAVSPGYFSAAQIPLRSGREFTLFDRAGSVPVAIVNQAFAAKFFPHENPIGRRIAISREASTSGWPSNEIVGVVANVNEFLGQSRSRPHIFVPLLQQPQTSLSLLIRVRTDPNTFAESIRQAVWSVDKDQAVTNIKTMQRVIEDAGQGDDLMAGLMGVFACIALLMAAFGIYGLIAYLVTRRKQEFGVRVALGASSHQVMMLVLRSSLRRVLTGVALGFIISLALPRMVAALFTGVGVHSGWIITMTPTLTIAIGLAASYFPARNASRVDPVIALRNE